MHEEMVPWRSFRETQFNQHRMKGMNGIFRGRIYVGSEPTNSVSNAVSELSLFGYLEQYGFALTQPLLLYRPAKTRGVPADELS